MMKWIRRLIMYPLVAIITLIAVLLFFNPAIYYHIEGMIGLKLLWYGYEEKANELIEKSISNSDGVSAELFRIYSIDNTKSGNYEESTKYLNKAADLDSANVDGYFGWCLLYYYRDYDKALFHLERLDNSTSFIDYIGDDNILYAKGLCYKQKGNYPKALELFQLAIEHESKDNGANSVPYQIYFQTGRTLDLLNRPSEAIEFYNLAIEDWEGSSESIYYKGLAEIELGIATGCQNLEIALEKVSKGIKSSDTYVRLFDEIYVDQVEEMIRSKCTPNNPLRN